MALLDAQADAQSREKVRRPALAPGLRCIHALTSHVAKGIPYTPQHTSDVPQTCVQKVTMPSSAHFDLISHWRIQAPVENVWAALADPPSWPRWWPYVRAVHTVRPGNAEGVGSIRRILWSTRLPYSILIEVEAVEALPNQRLRGRSSGQLQGEGIWLLSSEGSHTDITYVWRVTPTKRWMRWLAPLLAPVFRWNHDGVMRAGEAGLRRYLL